MDRFWVIFLSLAVVVPLSAATYFYFYNPFDGKDPPLDEAGYVWKPAATENSLSTATAFSKAWARARKTRQLYLAQDYEAVEQEIASARQTGYTPWYLGSWMAFYFKYLRDDPEQANSVRDISRAEQWLENSPNSLYAHTYLGDLYTDLGWTARGAKFRKDTPEQNFGEMKQYFKLAIAEYRKALAINPQNVYASRQLVRMAKSNCNREDLAEAFNQAIKYTRDYYYLYGSYVDALQPKWCGSNQEMFEFARRYAQDNEQNPVLARLVSRVHEYSADQLARKKSKYAWVRSYFKFEESGYWARYFRYFRDETIWQEYTQAYKIVFRAFPNYADGLYQYARAARQSGRIQTSLKYFELAMRADAAFLGEEKVYWIAGNFSKANHPAQASRYYRRYLDLVPENSDPSKVAYAADYVGWQYARERKYQESFPYYKKAAMLLPNSARSIANYCNAFFNNHEYESGKKYCKKAIDIDPNHAWSYNILSMIYTRTGDPVKSSEYRDKYNSLTH